MEKKSKPVLKLGDVVSWRGAYGRDPAQDAIVESIEVDCTDKAGEDVEELRWDQVDDATIVMLTNGHWAYGSQIQKKLDM